MANTYTCGEMAPPALAGSHSPLLCSRAVTRNGNHAGEHKAHKTIRGVGRITVQWKQSRHAGRPSVYRPEVDLPKKTNPYLTGQARKTEQICACPDWKMGIGHISPCPLVGQ